MKYKHHDLTKRKASNLIKKWGANAIWFCENSHGAVYWNASTGEILWIGDYGCNVQLLK